MQIGEVRDGPAQRLFPAGVDGLQLGIAVGELAIAIENKAVFAIQNEFYGRPDRTVRTHSGVEGKKGIFGRNHQAGGIENHAAIEERTTVFVLAELQEGGLLGGADRVTLRVIM